MKMHVVFLDWKTQHGKNTNSPKLIFRFNIYPTKIPERVFVDINKIILIFIWKCKETEIAKTILKKNRVGGISPHNFKTLYSYGYQDYGYW